MTNPYPSLEEFLALPLADVAAVAPATMVYSAAGSRRRMVLDGIPPEEYPKYSLQQMKQAIEMFFRCGVRHLFMPMLQPSNYKETTPGYREHIEAWVADGLAGSETLAYWQTQGWRVRMLGTDAIPMLREASERLINHTPQSGNHTLWFFIVSEDDLPWQWTIAAIRASHATTRAEAVRALYGEDIPPATLFISSGKPSINHDLVPPLLVGNMHCYWYCKPGYVNSEADFRTILYDYAYTRPTWKEDKTQRYDTLLEHREAWENAPIVGLGTRLGDFWYPQISQPMRGSSSRSTTMTSTPPAPSIQDIANYYDSMNTFYKIIWGESLHGGYWPDPDVDLPLPEAQEALTALMIEKTSIQPGELLLDVGCGTGLPAVRVSQATGCNVRGITIVQSQVDAAQQRAIEENVSDRVQFQWADAMELPFENESFDAAWSFEMIFHVPDRRQVLKEIARVLRPGRDLVLIDIIETKPLSDEQRAAWYPTFQISSITTLDGYQELFADSGLTQVDFVDLAQHAAKTLDKTKEGIQTNREALMAAYGPGVFEMMDQIWPLTDEIYRNHIKYVLFVARKTG